MTHRQTQSSHKEQSSHKSLSSHKPLSSHKSLSSLVTYIAAAVLLTSTAFANGPTSFPGQAVGAWTLDDGAGSTATDSSSNGLDGGLAGGTDWTAGQRASAGLFDGVDSLIEVTDGGESALDLTNGLTLALWVRPAALDGREQMLVSKDNAYELEVGKFGAATWDLRLDNVAAGTALTELEQDVWQHLAVTWDGTTVSYYYNGLLDSTHSFAGPIPATDSHLGLGGRPSAELFDSSVFHFAGALDEVLLFGRALDEAAVAELVLDSLTDVHPPVRSNLPPVQVVAAASNSRGGVGFDLTLDTDEDAICRYSTALGTPFDAMAGSFDNTGGSAHSTFVRTLEGSVTTLAVRCRDGLGNTNGDDATVMIAVGDAELGAGRIASWGFDEGAGCTVADAVGGRDGLLGPDCAVRAIRAPRWVVGHQGGSGVAFDRNDDAVRVTNYAGLGISGGLTISTWIRVLESDGYRALVDARDSGADGFDLYLEAQSKPFIRVNDKTLAGQTPVDDGQWHLVVGTYDGNSLKLYVDGALEASAAVGSTTVDVAADLLFGHHFTATADYSFGGELSQADLWSRALTDVEVVELYLQTR